MKFKLKGYLQTTANLNEFDQDICNFVNEANSDQLYRGVPKGGKGAKITEWQIKDQILEVEIEGTRFVTAHIALKRLKNLMIKKLGKKRVGVRSIFVKKYLIEIEASRERAEIIKAYPLVKAIELLDDEVRIILEDIEESILDRGDIQRLIKFVSSTERTIEKDFSQKVDLTIRRSKKKTMKFNEDPTVKALKLRWIIDFPGRGQWCYMPPFATLQTVLKNMMIDKVSKPLGFLEVLFPKLIPQEIAFTAKKIQGEPGGMFYVCPPRVRDKKEYIPFQVNAEITNKLPLEELEKLLEPPRYILDPAQCLPFYQMLRNKIIRKEDLPIKVHEYGGPTYRYEAGAVKGIERVCEFWRIEHVWLGTPDMVEEIRTKVMNRAITVVDKYLDLEWKLQFAGDPFYLAEDQKIDENVEIPEAPKYEWRFYMPFKGPRDAKIKDLWLACGSFNSHGSHYTKNFNIKSTSGDNLWTGCYGLGITRLVTAFLSQHGFDFEDWPKDVKKYVGKITNLPKPV